MNSKTTREKIYQLLSTWEYQIASHPYHTAYVARLDDPDLQNSAINYLLTHQYSDGSWGSEFEYEPDRLLSTLTVVNTLRVLGLLEKPQYIHGVEYINDHLQDLKTMETPLVGYSLTVANQLKSYIFHEDIDDPDLIKIVQKADAMIDRLCTIDITDTYYLWSLEVFPEEVVSKWEHERLLVENGSVAANTAASAFLYNLSDNIKIKNRIKDYLLQLGNEDGGFGNFYADHLAILFSTLVFEVTDRVDHYREILEPLIAKIAEDPRPDGISLGTYFPTSDLDDTSAFILLARSLNIEIPKLIMTALEKYKRQNHRTYLKVSQSVESSRKGPEIIETEILAKMATYYFKTGEKGYIDQFQTQIIRELRKRNVARWNVFKEYQYPQILLTLNCCPNEVLSQLVLDYCKEAIGELDKLTRDNFMRFVFVFLSLLIGIQQLDWKLTDTELSRLKTLAERLVISEAYLAGRPQFWISKVLYKIPLMDEIWYYGTMDLFALIKETSNIFD